MKTNKNHKKITRNRKKKQQGNKKETKVIIWQHQQIPTNTTEQQKLKGNTMKEGENKTK